MNSYRTDINKKENAIEQSKMSPHKEERATYGVNRQ